MDISKRNRSELKAYFVKNAIPTENDFADLIEGMLNQKDDGVVKQPGSALSLEATGDETSQKKVLNLYESFADAEPAWVLSLKARSNPSEPLSVRRGFSIAGSSGTSRLFIDGISGDVGIGTVEPRARLHVAGGALVDGKLQVGGGIEAAESGQPLQILGDVHFSGRVTAQSVASNEGMVQEAWKPLALQNKWVRYDNKYSPPGYFKDSVGVVHLRGVVKGGARGMTVAMCNLPEGYRPEYRIIMSLVIAGEVSGRLDVLPDGNVIAADVSPIWTSLDNVKFKAHH